MRRITTRIAKRQYDIPGLGTACMLISLANVAGFLNNVHGPNDFGRLIDNAANIKIKGTQLFDVCPTTFQEAFDRMNVIPVVERGYNFNNLKSFVWDTNPRIDIGKHKMQQIRFDQMIEYLTAAFKQLSRCGRFGIVITLPNIITYSILYDNGTFYVRDSHKYEQYDFQTADDLMMNHITPTLREIGTEPEDLIKIRKQADAFQDIPPQQKVILKRQMIDEAKSRLYERDVIDVMTFFNPKHRAVIKEPDVPLVDMPDAASPMPAAAAAPVQPRKVRRADRARRRRAERKLAEQAVMPRRTDVSGLRGLLPNLKESFLRKYVDSSVYKGNVDALLNDTGVFNILLQANIVKGVFSDIRIKKIIEDLGDLMGLNEPAEQLIHIYLAQRAGGRQNYYYKYMKYKTKYLQLKKLR